MRKSKLPIAVNPFFWIIAFFIGFILTGNFYKAIIVGIIVFISVLVHEFGHALMAIIFKQKPRIELNIMGGATSFTGKKLNHFQHFIIILAGPLAGLGLYFIATFLLKAQIFQNQAVIGYLQITRIINLFWFFVNLLPMQPLDGGQLLRVFLEGIFGTKGLKLSFIISFVFAFLLAMTSLVFKQYFLGVLFSLFAFQSIDMYRQAKNINKADLDENYGKKFYQAQMLLESGDKQQAEKLLQELRDETKKGMIYLQATHLLAFLALENKDSKKAYEYLLSIKDALSQDAICILHNLAFEENNYELVKLLSSSCFKILPNEKNALINARTFAYFGDAKKTAGWLKTALQFGNINLQNILMESYFKNIKNDPVFIKFFKK